MTAANKKSVYVDVDEEITSIIDKVRSAKESIVALILPKRATVFQSIVNMKLLKRAAEQDGKKVVLITSEPTILPIAGVVGIHVAANLNSKPYLPTAADIPEPSALAADAPVIDPMTPIGEVAGESIEIDNRPKTADAAGPATISAAAKKAKNGKGSKLKVPNFQRFRVLLIAGGVLLVLLILFGYWALAIAPKATITLRGETNDANLAFDIIADTAATALDEEAKIVPAKTKELKKSDSEKVPATGQKDKGSKASGTVSMKNCSQSDGSVTVPAGTGVSSGDFTFITQAALTLDPSVFSGGGTCLSSAKDVAVVSQQAGDRYNVSARSYAVSGFGGVVANGSAMSGGTSQLVKVVSAGDVETAKQKLIAKQTLVTDELKKGLENEGYVPLSETFATNSPTYNPSPGVDSEANEVTVTAETTYTMLGLKEEDLHKLVEKEADKDETIDTSKQAILSDGLKNATFNLGAKKTTRTNINVQTKVVAGPNIDKEAIKRDLAGKKKGDAEQILKARPGIKEVRIETKPFWNYSIPKKVSKIDLIIEEADGSKIAD